MEQRVGTGGFELPQAYRHSRKGVLNGLAQGNIDLVDVSRWQLADEFIAFLLKSKFLEHADRTYPNPRQNNLVPVWFLISSLLLLRTVGDKAYKNLDALLSAGPVLSRVGFNVISPIGFNDRNKYPRKTPIHQDTARKFFKDTEPLAIRKWFYKDLQSWFKRQGMFDPEGVFIIDQTHVVVPDNANYKDAVRMPVDAHGQWYKNYSELTEEQKHALPHHPCYTLSTLLHLNLKDGTSHFVGYEWGAGNIDELPQAQKLLDRFFEENEYGTIKLLIMDRGYVSGKFISFIKSAYHVDVLIPLKANMEQGLDAIAIAKMPETKWSVINPKGSIPSDPSRAIKACFIEEVKLWDACSVPLHTTVFEDTHFDTSDPGGWVVRHFVIVSTKKFDTPNNVIHSYSLRSKTEECFRQLKLAWNIGSFPSTNKAIIEAHVAFTLLAFCLFQLFLAQKDFKPSLTRFISSLRREQHKLHYSLVVYSSGCFEIFGCKEFIALLTSYPQEVQQKINASLDAMPNQF